jgi:hypothetical protein
MAGGCSPVSPGTEQFEAEAIKAYRRSAWRRDYLRRREVIWRSNVADEQKGNTGNEAPMGDAFRLLLV